MRSFHVMLILSFFLTACSLPPTYMGDKLPPTKHVDVYYNISDIKHGYKVIGHLQSHKYIKSTVERDMSVFAKRYGGDAVIIFRAEGNRVNADVLKYTR